MAYTFNGPAKTITIGGTGAVTITANDLYSRWVDWVHTGVGAGYDEVMRAIGGEDIGGGLTSGVYVFLGLGWSLVMPATITTLTVQGNVTRDPDDVSGAALYINQGAGLIVREVSAIALGYSSGSGLNSTQSTQLAETWQRAGLDASNPVTRASDGEDVVETFGDVTITHNSNGTDSVTSTRS